MNRSDNVFESLIYLQFFYVVDPSLRPAWAQCMSDLLGPSPVANLICVEVPTTKPIAVGGPPFASPSKAYMEYQSHPGEEIAYDAEGGVDSNPLTPASPGGLEQVAHFSPKDTHRIARNEAGDVVDPVAIWRHRY